MKSWARGDIETGELSEECTDRGKIRTVDFPLPVAPITLFGYR